MKGNNTFSICQAQMIDIVQQWLDKFILDSAQSPTVTNIKWDQGENCFHINTTEREKESSK